MYTCQHGQLVNVYELCIVLRDLCKHLVHGMYCPAFDSLLLLLQDKDLQLVNWRSTAGFASLNRSNLVWHIIISQHSRHKQTEQQQLQTDYHKQAARAVTVAWDQLFGAELGPLPDELYVNGGGQFLVRRERVLAHSRSFYQECLTWLDESLDLSPWDKGMVFEYTWKNIFGEAAAVLDQNIWS